MSLRKLFLPALILMSASSIFASTQDDERVAKLKEQVAAEVELMRNRTQQMVDMIFSFGELGFQEYETSRYLTGILRENGFQVEEGVSGIPTAWVARWGAGKPVLSFGSDIDGIPRASQKPGVAFHDPLVEGAPGHGEGHNSGQALNVTAALALKKIMEKEGLEGTLVLWPGVAEELVATKAYFVRDGLFSDVDAVIFTHVSDSLSVTYGYGEGSGLISVEYTFRGEAAHAGGAPWRGKSALDAVELMNHGWNAKREHLRLPQRSHYVITNGGDQPNVVPELASVWYYFREIDDEHIRQLYEIGNQMAEAAALMTGTRVERRILGSAWPRYFNKPMAEAAYANIVAVGMPEWSAADLQLAKALQKELGSDQEGLKEKVADPPKQATGPFLGGGSDDIGDVSWNRPTITLRFPANIPGLPGHHWANAVAMATPIAHKGTTAGAKVLAMTTVDLLLKSDLIGEAWTYFREEQKGGAPRYQPFISEQDQPATYLNQPTMERYREQMKPYYFDPTRFGTYLEQLGIKYPTVREAAASDGSAERSPD